ncbi:hypothetical protein [uncultured Eudoraea sp.]|uniref:hypothetical protein n=1 Tax=uncultured Eudoraea sp. TaxID=1035614 RepID=UPI00261B3663|nr:hypothetical protein [uncultured Eudoraea sp.]
MKKDNIDKLYREKLKDFNEVPDEKVWEAISASLDKKKKSSRIIPLWWKLGGIAAVLAILMYVYIPSEENMGSDVIITDVENTSPKNDSGIDALEKDLPVGNNDESEDVVNPAEKSEESENAIPSNDVKKSKLGLQNNSAITKSAEKQNTKKKEKADDGKKSDVESGIASVGSKDLQNKAQKDDATEVDRESQNTKIAVIDSPDNKAMDKVNQPRLPQKNPNMESPTVKKNAMDGVAVLTDNKKEEEQKAEKPKKSIFDEIEKTKEPKVVESKVTKWSVGPNIAPVYFSSFGNGSPIHSNFVSSSKSGNVNLSYGLTVSYDISKKLSIRSGLHKTNYSYDTNEISFSASLTASTNNQIDNINYVSTSKNLVVRNNDDNRISQEAVNIEVSGQSPARDGRMTQDFGYIELPLEVNFALLDKKFGINVIGGLSSLFLVDNSVVLESNGNSVEMGEANNINNVNLSTNIGFGLNYKFSKTLQLNLEPMFKYQLNTFSETAGNFQPFSVGVYTGLNFKF